MKSRQTVHREVTSELIKPLFWIFLVIFMIFMSSLILMQTAIGE
jgi:hypothetical protein